LLSKVFLHYLVLLGDLGDGETLLELWLKIVTIMDRLINSGQGDNLVSSLPTLTSFYPFPSRLSPRLCIENSLTLSIGRSRFRKFKKHAPRHVQRRLPRASR
jgi:hypothetical protein